MEFWNKGTDPIARAAANSIKRYARFSNATSVTVFQAAVSFGATTGADFRAAHWLVPSRYGHNQRAHIRLCAPFDHTRSWRSAGLRIHLRFG
jgi:hypothetical protein